ncbi:hypothetical protein [Prosthecomicrobium pneumaticum]|uniref:Oxidoreductase molybdopterin-binding domain-containing protein n=1 Tax=Prosthecomicrobium pneumaticum TaxID=81895 RepID=A0A7W9FIS6_9HYPH|nr:hypothetical protein [Prosthecomicrobium pneumaticum]MBB5751002.1 hypothetical protein [Prosthecomicrobium pneumaticum]
MFVRLAVALMLWVALLAGGARSTPAVAEELALRWLTRDGRVLAERTLTLSDLDGLEQSRIETATPWTEGPQVFTGPSFAVLAGLTGERPAEAEVVALNDYSATVPAGDWFSRGVILSTRLNGETMRVRDKGPYWVMYPIDRDSQLERQDYQSRMVWQVKSIDFISE